MPENQKCSRSGVSDRRDQPPGSDPVRGPRLVLGLLAHPAAQLLRLCCISTLAGSQRVPVWPAVLDMTPSSWRVDMPLAGFRGAEPAPQLLTQLSVGILLPAQPQKSEGESTLLSMLTASLAQTAGHRSLCRCEGQYRPRVMALRVLCSPL